MIPEKINSKILKRDTLIVAFLVLVVFIFLCFEIYVPANPFSNTTVAYVVEKGSDDVKIAKDLQQLKIIRSPAFFQFYVVASFQHSSLQAGKYNFSARMSVYDIVKKMSRGDVIKNEITLLAGWDSKDISQYLEEKDICKKGEFLDLIKNDYSLEFDFLKDKPKTLSIEGYIFPDTYQIAEGDTCQDVIGITLANFGKKLDAELRAEITKQKKSIFDIVVMASMLEKEMRTLADKKMVSGILWKRLEIGMPLQLDATVNYITNKNDPGVSIKDTKIDSPYNTYKYKGLPKGPISSPGMDSIRAAIYPKANSYLFYQTGKDGKTIFSRTLQEHILSKPYKPAS
jgi:UPF0755 protein